MICAEPTSSPGWARRSRRCSATVIAAQGAASSASLGCPTGFRAERCRGAVCTYPEPSQSSLKRVFRLAGCEGRDSTSCNAHFLRMSSPGSTVQTSPNDSFWGPGEVLQMAKVLIVDDNHDAADTLAMLLGEWGYTTAVAYDGVTALDIAASFN